MANAGGFARNGRGGDEARQAGDSLEGTGLRPGGHPAYDEQGSSRQGGWSPGVGTLRSLPTEVKRIIMPALSRLSRVGSGTVTDWYVAPKYGDLEVQGVSDQGASIARHFPVRHGGETWRGEAEVELVHQFVDPQDPRAVAVLLRGRVAGQLPPECASAWAAFIDEHRAAGRRVRASAELMATWPDDEREPTRHLYLRVPADPAAYAERERLDHEREARRAEKVRAQKAIRAEKERARQALAALVAEHSQRTEPGQARAVAWRAAGLCVDCGAPPATRVGPGRPSIRCPRHLAEETARSHPSQRRYATLTCPYCSAPLEPPPTVEGPCPACGRWVHLAVGPDGYSYLLQDIDVRVIDEAWAEATEKGTSSFPSP